MKIQYGWTKSFVCGVVVVVENCRFELRFLPIPSFSVDVVFALGRYGSF